MLVIIQDGVVCEWTKLPPWETFEIIINILVLLTLDVCGGHFISQDVEMRHGVSLVAQMVKNLPAMQETQVWALGWEDPLEKGKATHSSTLAWKIPWTERSLVGYSQIVWDLVYLDVKPLLDTSFANIHSRSVGCLSLYPFVDGFLHCAKMF